MSPRQRLIVEPILGLSNRLHVLASAGRFAELSGRTLAVMWNSHHHPGQAAHSNCLLDDLFDHNLTQVPSFEAAGASAMWFTRYPRYTTFEPRDLPGAVPLETGPIDPARFHHVPVVGITTFLPLLCRGDGPQAAARAAETFARGLRPVPWIEQAVRTFCRRHFQGPMLGVHIRRGDFEQHLAATGSRPTSEEDFWGYVAACLAGRLALRVFCASDDAGVKERFVRRFADRACTYNDSALDRATIAGAQGALIDLLLLGRTDFICATPRSSFGRAAVLLRPADSSSCHARPLDLLPGISTDPAALDAAVRQTLAALDASAQTALLVAGPAGVLE